ncbi:neuropilin and tolloid-like protein 2 isoform X2 [Anthonomus grandis grandis]|uniref:neuropilin and tolloid-like protein 2 isoform X2 n=1 Tax=Anthonomus grandis grandis TaxID=2921223 RepID=UPI0021664C53|nr:neuropilin and tolloid-like protein 2 isoform X2 [Anthonomus grandis grandis]
MVSIRCAGLLLWVSYAINLPTTSLAQLETGDIEFATTESPEMPEYMNPYPLLHPCHRFADITNNEFYSPASPPDAPTYPNNTNCTLVLTAPKNHVIDLDFLDWFEIEKSDGCKNDFLEVRDGKYGFNNVLLHFCGINEFPPNVRSSNRHLWIYFKSDENIEGKGFRAVFHYVPRANKSSVPEIKECKKEISFKEEGRFSKDDIPADIIEFDKQHDLPIDCMWVITVRYNWRIQLQFEAFKLETPNDCESNFVEVFSNNTINSKKKFCGSMADTVLSEVNHNVMIVRFYSQHSRGSTTFAANFTAYRDSKKDKTNAKRCLDNEFDCEDYTCISSTLRCNERYNCRFRWDEEGCHGGENFVLTDDHIVIIMVIFSLILAGMFITFVYNCIKKLLRDHKTIKEFKRSREQLDKDLEDDKRSSKTNSGPHRTPSVESTRFGPTESGTAPCYVPDKEDIPKMCDSACQTRESLFTSQEYSSGNSTPNNSVHTNSPPAPFSTFGYNRKDSNKFKAEAKIEMHREMSNTPSSKYDKRYSVQTTKSAPDVIVTH